VTVGRCEAWGSESLFWEFVKGAQTRKHAGNRVQNEQAIQAIASPLLAVSFLSLALRRMTRKLMVTSLSVTEELSPCVRLDVFAAE
jgi:hypothetical protein